MFSVCVRGNGCCSFCLNCEVLSRMCLCMGSMSVSSCKWCMLVSCVHPVNALQFVYAGRKCKWRPYGTDILQSRYHDYLIGSHECLLLFAPCCCGE